MLSWGSNDHGQLGQGSVNATAVVGHQWAACPCPDRVAGVACGLRHTVAITVNGDVYSCGSNEKGQLGTDSERQSSFDEVLVGKPVQQASCGFEHTVAVTKKGQVFTWGDNRYGQLGRQLDGDDRNATVPGPVVWPHPVVVCQVSCGAKHTLVLTKTCQVFSWGSNEHGQLGVGILPADLTEAKLPSLVENISGMPTVFVAAGGTHSFALSACGSVFAFGSNTEGQIGMPIVNETTGWCAPTCVSSLHDKQIRYIACGYSHTAALSESGEVFTFGNGSHGQLGHGDAEGSDVPRMLNDVIARQIACGREHTLIMLKLSGKILAFGRGIHGQLSLYNLMDIGQPSRISGNWIVAEDENQPVEAGRFPGGSVSVDRVVAGGNHSFALVAGLIPQLVDFTEFSCPSLIARRTPSLPFCLTNGNDQGPLKNFHNISVMLSEACDTRHLGRLIRVLKTALMCPSCINGSFIDSKKCLDRSGPGVDVVKAHSAFRLLNNAEILSGIPFGFEKLEMAVVQALSGFTQGCAPPGCEHILLRLYLLLPEIPVMSDVDHFDDILLPFVSALNLLPKEQKETLVSWWSKLPTAHLQRRVDMLQELSEDRLTRLGLCNPFWGNVHAALAEVCCTLNILSLLYDANLQSGERILLESFYMESLSSASGLDLSNQLCCYPFALDVVTKGALLIREACIEQMEAFEQARTANSHKLWMNHFMPWLAGELECPHLLIGVRRQHLCDDTLKRIKCLAEDSQLEWRKPLQVCFQGEPGLDWGGVRKEFFMLIFEKLFSQEAGLFVPSDTTPTLWFNEWADDMDKFFLVGILCGLAVYNNILVNVTFPLFLYCKLLERFHQLEGTAASASPLFCGYDRVLQRKPSLKDLSEIDPELAQSLEQNLHEDVNVSDYGLKFETDRPKDGSTVPVELIPGGADIDLTNQNRSEYIEAYLDYIFRRSVEQQFDNFARGFLLVCHGDALRLFHPKELMEIVAGQTLDEYDVLEEIAEYGNGFFPDHPVVCRFWAVFHRLTLELKRKFMIFLTGSDRVSVAVRETMKVKIIPHPSGDANFLPVAHTCFNLLELPPYETENALEQKLCYAIENAKGFQIE